MRHGGVVEADPHYISVYRRWDHYFSQLDPFDFIIDLSEQFHQLIRDKINQLKAQLRQMIMEYLVSLAEEITGIKLRHERDKSIEDALNRAGSASGAHIRAGTSIESRLPGALEWRGRTPTWRTRRMASSTVIHGSHSHLPTPDGKDHPPHEPRYGPDAPLALAEPGEHDIEEGSIFYGLHRDPPSRPTAT